MFGTQDTDELRREAEDGSSGRHASDKMTVSIYCIQKKILWIVTSLSAYCYCTSFSKVKLKFTLEQAIKAQGEGGVEA